MQLSPSETALIAQYLLSDFEREMATTRKVIAAMPDGMPEYAPSAKCTPALKLAGHIAGADDMFLRSIGSGALHYESEWLKHLKSGADVLAWFDEHLPAALDVARNAPPEAWSREIDLFGMAKFTGLQILTLALKHSIHHRGQLSAYLRPMGGKVPGIYGPSADDK